MSGTAVCVVAGGTDILLGTLYPDIPAVEQVLINLLGFGVAALPVSIGVAILRYRLYEIDRIVSRTLAYAIVTGLLVGVYAGIVLLATRVLPLSSPAAVAGATLAAAALFSDLRVSDLGHATKNGPHPPASPEETASARHASATTS
jgi:hypothetical protein